MNNLQLSNNIILLYFMTTACGFAWVNIWNWFFFDETMTENERVRRRGIRSIVCLAVNFVLGLIIFKAMKG